MPPFQTKTRFRADAHTTAVKKNSALAQQLLGAWKKLAIVKIDRIEIGSQSGWLATYRA